MLFFLLKQTEKFNALDQSYIYIIMKTFTSVSNLKWSKEKMIFRNWILHTQDCWTPCYRTASCRPSKCREKRRENFSRHNKHTNTCVDMYVPISAYKLPRLSKYRQNDGRVGQYVMFTVLRRQFWCRHFIGRWFGCRQYEHSTLFTACSWH
jgi:hypothetical protein